MEIKLVDSDYVENTICEDVKNEEVKNLLDIVAPQMEGITKAENGGGLAAIQVGINKKFFVAWNKEQKKFLSYFNAFYVKNGDTRVKITEGCLSYPGKEQIIIKRYKNIKLIHDAWNESTNKLEKQSKSFGGTSAFILQHEVDHCFSKTIYQKG